MTSTPGGRRWLFGLLYLAEGAPIGFLWWALPAYLRLEGVGVADVAALTAALAVPWSLKFLWAPLVDRAGHRGLWVALCQLVMGVSLAAAVFAYLRGAVQLAAAALILHAFAAATQDVAIDAWAIGVTPEHERGRLTASMQAGMLTGRWLFGAGLLLVAGRIGLSLAAGVLVAVLWALMVVAWLAGGRQSRAESVSNWRQTQQLIWASLRRRAFWLGCGFALLGGAGYEAVGAVAGPFLVDRGYSAGQVGWFLSLSVVLMMGGAFVGGKLADRANATRATGRALAFIAALVAALAAADALGSAGRLLALGAVYFGIGVFTASSYAMFMNLVDRRLAAFQFSAFMAGTNGCEAWAAFCVGRFAGQWDYAPAFLLMAALSLTAWPVLIAIRNQTGTNEPLPAGADR